MLDSRCCSSHRPTLVAGYLSLLIGLSVVCGSVNAELLGRISDDNAPAASPAVAPAKKNDDRRITYRVICSPEDQDLPDCDRSLDDGNDAGQAAVLPTPDLPPDKEDLVDAAKQPEATPPAAAAKSKQAASKKGDQSKKAAKKSSVKSTSSKGKKRSRR